MTAEGKIIGGRTTYRYFEVYCSLAIIYWVITFILERIIRLIESKIEVPAEVPERDENGKILHGRKAKAQRAARLAAVQAGAPNGGAGQ